MEGIDVDISWMIGFLTGGEGGLQGWVAAIALIIASIRLKAMAEISVSLVRLDKTLEENTRSQIENTKLLRKMNADKSKLPH